MRFPWTRLALGLYPLWLLKRGLLGLRRWQLRRSTTDRWFDEVDPSIVVGGALFPGDLEALRAIGVKSVLSLCAEYRDDASPDVTMHRISCHDDFAVPVPQLAEAVRWIDERVALGEKVYVHCAAGRGRSVSVVVAWLVKRRGLSVERALAQVQSVRRAARPAPWQLAAVRRYVERQTRGSAHLT